MLRVASFWEVVTVSKRWGEKRKCLEAEEEDYGCSSASRRRTSGTHRPITAALLISTQHALCQKSDTVQAPWTSSPFNSTQRAFYGLKRASGVRAVVCDRTPCSLCEGQRAP